MNSLAAGYLNPLKELDTSNSISRVADDFDAKLDYADSINEINGLHDELALLTPAKEAYAKLQALPKSVFRSIALEAMGSDHDVKMALINKRIAELK